MIATVADSREFMEERALESFTKQSLVSHSSYNDRSCACGTERRAVDRVSRVPQQFAYAEMPQQ